MTYDICISQNRKQKLISKTNKNVKNQNYKPLIFNVNSFI